MSLLGSSNGILGGYGGDPFGGGLYSLPFPVQDPNVIAPDPLKKVKPEDAIERTFYSPLYGSRELRSGFDKAPPPSLDLFWKMQRFSAIVLAFAALSRQILSGTQSVEIFNKTADPELAAKIKAAAEEDLLSLVLQWLEASLECLHFGNLLQEVIWTRKNGRTVPSAFRPVLPGLAILYQDIYGQFSGFQIGNDYRDARYALLSVNKPHIHPIAGYSRNENCREEYWRIKQSDLNADKTENKASDRQMVIKWPMGLSLTDDKGNQVFSQQFAQQALNAAVRGDAIVVPRFFWTQATLAGKPELAEIEPVTVDNIDWGNIGPSIDAHLARTAALKTDCQRAWSRPERESSESKHGSKADSESAADLGTSDSEAVAAERMREFNTQIFDRWAVTNFGPNAAGICGLKQSPLSDPKQDFLQKQSIAITSDQTTGPGYQANFDQRALAERVGIPLVSEEEAQQVIAKQQEEKDSQAQQHAQAMEAIKAKGATGQDDEQPAPAGNGKMRLSADAADEQEDIAARLMEYMRPLELDASQALTGGEWKTIDGAHVYIKDGVVVAGAKGMIGGEPQGIGANHYLVGKTEEGVKSHGKSSPDDKTGYHAIERDATGKYKGTRQLDGSIKHVQEHADRLEKTRAQPGHTDVYLSHDPEADAPVVGTDSKGRQQAPRSEAATKRAKAEKFLRNEEFHAALPAIRERLEADLGGKNAEEAAVLSLIDKTGFRIGGDDETGADVKAYGASTLNSSHVKVDGDKIEFNFTGKKGVQQSHVLHDPKLAAMLAPRVANGGNLFDTNDSKTGKYLKNISGNDSFKNKDFRTNVARETATKAVQSMPVPATMAELKKARMDVATIVARKLGNNPSESLKSYIPPKVFAKWNANAANREQASLILKHAKATGMSEGDAAKDWITKNAKDYREKFNKLIA